SFIPHPATTAPSPLSLHDALPIYSATLEDLRARGLADGAEAHDLVELDAHRTDRDRVAHVHVGLIAFLADDARGGELAVKLFVRSEEHTSELQSQSNLVCRLLLEK